MTTRFKHTLLAINPGCGAHLISYSSQGIEPRYAIEPKPLARECLAKNLGLAAAESPAVSFDNRKQKGMDELLAALKLRGSGALDILEINATGAAPKHKGHEENLFDLFGIARRLAPKIVVAYAPPEICATKNRWKFEGFIDFLRFTSLRNKTIRRYYANYSTIDAADYGSPVRRSMTLIVALRCDIAEANGITTDEAMRYVFPRARQARTFAEATSGLVKNRDDEDFWYSQTSKNNALRAAIGLLPAANPKSQIRTLTTRERKTTTYKKPLAVAGENDVVPDTARYAVVHPKNRRILSVTELCALFAIPKEWGTIGSSVDFHGLLSEAIPPCVTAALAKSTLIPVLTRKLKIPKNKKGLVGKIELVETLRDKRAELRTYNVDVDRGIAADKKRKGETPTERDFDYLFDANEINEDFIVYGPYDDDIGAKPIIGAIRRKVFTEEKRNEAIRELSKIISAKSDWSDQRISAAPPYTDEEIAAEIENRGAKNVVVKKHKRAMAVRKKDGEFDRFRGKQIPSIMVGWYRDDKSPAKKGRNRIKLSDIARDKKRYDSPFWAAFNERANAAYRRLAFDDWRKQSAYLKGWIAKSVRLGDSVFTTMSIQRYTPDDLPTMSYHTDSDDENAGLTTITAFEEGEYRGGYFVLPRWRCAFKIGDGDVFVANSNQVHGVTASETTGTRYSVVSYLKTALASKHKFDQAYPPKSPRPKFNIRGWQVAIPSKDRSELIVEKSLKTLARHQVPPHKVTIFVADKKQYAEYEKTIAEAELPYKNLVIATPGVREVRTFAEHYYKEGTPVVFMDDDIESIKVLGGDEFAGGKFKESTNLFEQVIYRGFNAARESNAYLWGINAVGNAGWASGAIKPNPDAAEYKDGIRDYDEDLADFLGKVGTEKVSIGNYYIIGSFYGVVIRHSKDLSIVHSGVPVGKNGLLIGDKEDNERSILHFIKDGRVVRLDYVTVKTKYYSGSGGVTGGMEFQRNLKTIELAAKYMAALYPKYCRARLRTSGEHKGKWEVEHR